MKKSMFLAVIFLAMAMFSTAFAQYESVEVVPSPSTTYNDGLVAIQLYLKDSGEWVQQLKVYNETPVPGYDHPAWSAAAAMTYENTVAVGTTGRVRTPTFAYVWPADMSSQPAVAYYIFGDAEVLATVKSALSATGLSVYYGEADSQIIGTAIGTVNAAVIYGVTSGSVVFFPVYDSSGQSIFNPARLKAILAADSFRF